MTYSEALNYIHSIDWRGSRLGLDRTKTLLGKMGNPQDKLKFIHVAGTNGKGSTCAMTASILKESGLKTGLYTSPYLYRFNERMKIDGVDISDSELASVTEYVKQYADEMTDDPPTEFELVTAIGMEYFYRNNCDIVVLEVGLGGEFDSTNIIRNPEVCVITAIDLDHTAQLGPTVKDVAKAKAGIIKDSAPVVFYGMNDEAEAVIKDKCRETGSELFIAEASASDGYDLSLLGTYQKYNANVVLKIIEVLKEKGYKITDENIRQGLLNVYWPGRFEILQRKPDLIVDGGHNPHGVRGTVESLKFYYPGRKIHFVMGMLADKDVNGSLDIILPVAEDFITVSPDSPRAMQAKELSEIIKEKGGKAITSGSVKDGIKLALSNASEDDIICAIGSLYSYGEIKDLFINGCFGKI